MSRRTDRRFRLVGLSGPAGGRELRLSGELVRVGRTNENELVLDDRNISRRHAELHLDTRRLLVRDLGSKNGTFVNGRRVDLTDLAEGDVVQWSGFAFRVKVEKDESIERAGSRSGRRRLYLYGAVIGVFLLIGLTYAPKPAASRIPTAREPITRPQLVDSSVTAPVNATEEEILTWKTRADGAIAYDDVAAAIPLLENVLAVRPGDRRARSQLDRAKNRLGDLIAGYYENGAREYERLYFEKAIREWQKVLALAGPFDPETYGKAEEKIREARARLALKN